MKGCLHHLITYTPPHKDLSSDVDVICMHVLREDSAGGARAVLTPDDRHADGRVFNLRGSLAGSAGKGPTFLILSISRLYCTNDIGSALEFFIDLDFMIPHPDINHHHPDHTGRVRFIIPEGANGVVPKRDRLLYQPNCANVDIDYLAYAGMENAILNEKSFAVSATAVAADVTIYKLTDPLVVFMMNNMKHFPEINVKKDLARIDGDPSLIVVSKKAAKVVSGFFQTAVFGMLRYKESKECYLSWTPLKGPPREEVEEDLSLMTQPELDHYHRRNNGFAMLVLQLQIEYLVITPDAPPRFESVIKDLF